MENALAPILDQIKTTPNKPFGHFDLTAFHIWYPVSRSRARSIQLFFPRFMTIPTPSFCLVILLCDVESLSCAIRALTPSQLPLRMHSPPSFRPTYEVLPTLSSS
jgi:hypothetical protein